MDSAPECKTPEADNGNKPELLSPSLQNTPLTRTSSSKRLLTPCRQVGLKRKSLKRTISQSINGTEIACTSNSSPLAAANESECITTPSPLKKLCVSKCKDTLSANQNSQVDVNNIKDDDKGNLHENAINSISCTKAAQCEISDSSLLTTKKESTLASELIKLNNECKFKITPKRTNLKKRYRPTSQCERALTYENCEVSGENVQKKIDINTDRSVHSNIDIKDIHWSSASKIPYSNDFSHVVKTVPVSGEIKPGEDLTDKIRIMRQYVKEKEEQLRLLKLAQLYRKKHDPEKMAASINRWKEICKAALYRLQVILTSRGQPMSMADLLAQFGIPHDVLKFNSETDDFE